jgi:hypothetical protein
LLNFLERQVQRSNAVIADAIQAIPHALETIPGCGPALSAGIIAEIGDLACVNSPCHSAQGAADVWFPFMPTVVPAIRIGP